MREGWEKLKLGDVITLHYGKGLPKEERDADGVYPAYGANGIKCRTNRLLWDRASIIVGRKGSAGEVTLVDGGFWALDVTYYIEIDESRHDLQFVYHLLSHLNLPSLATGVKPGINRDKVYSIESWFPPLAEQKRIVAILDEAFEAIERAEIAYNSILDCVDSSMSRFFAQLVPTKGHSSWTSATIADVAVQRKGTIRTGPFGSQLLHSEFVDDGVRVLGIDNAVHNEFAWDQIRCITDAKYEGLRRYTVHPGDVIITIMGTCGRCAVIPSDIPLSITSKHLCCITLDQQRCLPEFLKLFFLKHPIARQHLASQTKGAIMDGLNMAIIKSVPLMLPSIEEQEEIVDRLSEFQNGCTDLSRIATDRRDKCDELRSSILSTAFRGELDQSASRETSYVGAAP
ncbi:MAG: restriction endonuclease subunit S [Phycisphaerales bacterium JB052]